jgi:hypothetical protein
VVIDSEKIWHQKLLRRLDEGQKKLQAGANPTTFKFTTTMLALW